jgi:hypothetical protein
MRMMATVRIPVATGSRTIKDGTLPQVIQKTLEHLKPECAYFVIENGKRTMRAVFEMRNEGDMVPAFEPAMMQLDAEIELTPCMTAEDLKSGFQAMGQP